MPNTTVVSHTETTNIVEKATDGNSSNGNLHKSPVSQRTKRGFRFWAIVAGLAIATFQASLENSVIVTAGPTIVQDLQMGEEYIWITNAFFLGCAASQPLFGQLCNVFGRRWLMLSATAIFTIGSGVCGGATKSAMLIAGRAVQGAGSGGITSITSKFDLSLLGNAW
ncbi:major facilitator superfamily domain-containing protein [Xylaria sp. FL0064]|nr:major facilitator superfamily domain-containing protein [Xylaria sp. FL0064]